MSDEVRADVERHEAAAPRGAPRSAGAAVVGPQAQG